MLKVAIASGKGGTGKTFVTTNLYRVMKAAGRLVGVVDCDAEVPNAGLFLKGQRKATWPVEVFCPVFDADRCTYCGECASVCHFHAITCIPALRYLKILPDGCHSCEGCSRFCPFGALSAGTKRVGEVTAYGDGDAVFLYEARLQEGAHSPVPVIREAIRRAVTANWEILLLDAPPGCACPFVHTVKDADLVILVTEPTPFGLSDLKHTIMVLQQLHKPFGVVVNRADLGDEKLQQYLAEEGIPLWAVLPYDPSVAVTYSKGALAVDHHASFCHQFECLMQKVGDYEGCSH
ncbi:Cobyrinic acid a,c-diamide synthase [gut metagenome]|uniref:Cobyrinic acid a,c-diamide synthase n=1 Tax=gut metagenome TaxID=749906 RepID=J9FQK1_9ZZZZ